MMGCCCQDHPFPLPPPVHSLTCPLLSCCCWCCVFPTELCGIGHRAHTELIGKGSVSGKGEEEFPHGFPSPVPQNRRRRGLTPRLEIWEGGDLSRTPTHSRLYGPLSSAPLHWSLFSAKPFLFKPLWDSGSCLQRPRSWAGRVYEA